VHCRGTLRRAPSVSDAGKGVTAPKILLVDDDVELLDMLKTYMERDGFEVAVGDRLYNAVRRIAFEATRHGPQRERYQFTRELRCSRAILKIVILQLES
jgi:DNA-binding response OmpR family regulator